VLPKAFSTSWITTAAMGFSCSLTSYHLFIS
jgi:hypothetical protein